MTAKMIKSETTYKTRELAEADAGWYRQWGLKAIVKQNKKGKFELYREPWVRK